MPLTTRLLPPDEVSGVREEWDALCRRTGALPFVRPDWMQAWAAAFEADLQVVTAYDGDVLRAVLPVVRRRSGALASPTNWHTPGFAPVADSPDASDAVVLAALDRARGHLELSFVDETMADRLSSLATSRGHRTARRVLVRSPYLEVGGRSFEEHVRSREKSKRRKVARVRTAEQKLAAEHGPVTFEVSTTVDPTALRDFLAVEDAGWKARSGTSVRRDTAARSFYTDLVDRFGADGTLRLAVLRAGSTPVAGELGLEQDGVHYSLKVGYDEEFRSYGPGQVLHLHLISEAFDDGLACYELLGDDARWKRDWTSTTRALERVHLFTRGPLGLTSAWWQGRGRPATVRGVRRWRALRSRHDGDT